MITPGHLQTWALCEQRQTLFPIAIPVVFNFTVFLLSLFCNVAVIERVQRNVPYELIELHHSAIGVSVFRVVPE